MLMFIGQMFAFLFPGFGASFDCCTPRVLHLSRVMRKPLFWFPTWSNTNQAVQIQKMLEA